MTKLFELIGTLMATACLIQIASDPAGVVKEIRLGPVPSLVSLDQRLTHPLGPAQLGTTNSPEIRIRAIRKRFGGE